MTTTVQVLVRLKKSVLDPQGSAVLEALNALGFSEVTDVRVGKLIEMTVSTQDENALQEMAKKLLVNPVVEDYEICL